MLGVSEQTGYDASTRPTPIKPLGLAVFLFSISQEIYTLSKPNTSRPVSATFPTPPPIFWRFYLNPPAGPRSDAVT